MITLPGLIGEQLARAARETPGLEVLLLFGSRTRQDVHAGSDWDFGFVAAVDIDASALVSQLAAIVGSDRVDLVDLQRAGGLLRYRAARDGQVLFERRAGAGDRFRYAAAQFWCDAAPVLWRGYEKVLAELTP